AWTCGNSGAVWNDDVRRRVRAFGIVAYVRHASAQARLRLDQVRRLGWPRQTAVALAILGLQPGPGQLAKWQPIHTEFQLNRTARNPYDPDEADVVAEIEGPGGTTRTHPAYWHEPYRLDYDGQSERATAAGVGAWRWRWTPPTPGAWRWRIVAKVKAEGQWQHAESAWQSVKVDSAVGGMAPIQIDPHDASWFSTGDGKFWYPIGINMRSPGDSRQDPNIARLRMYQPMDQEPESVRGWNSIDWERRGTRSYERWFPLMAAHGMNWARVWMCPWWCGLEWRKEWDDYGGLLWYNQANAARMDRVVDLAVQHGVYLQVELMNHGQVAASVDTEWKDSPYNSRNGGICAELSQWFRQEDVWTHQQKRLRYTIARWGWCTGIAAWSLCSEMEFTGTFHRETGGNDRGHSPSLEAWVKRCLTWMRSNEIFPDRPTTIHFSKPWSDPELWRIPGLGFSNSNVYTAFQDFDAILSGGQSGTRNLPVAMSAYLNQLFSSVELKRPTLLGEWGGHWADNEPWVLFGELRAGLWLQACTPYAGNTGFWWWLWVDVADQWKAYEAVAKFLQNEDPRGVTWTRSEPAIAGANLKLCAQGMRSENAMRIYVWPRGFDQDHRRVARDAAGDMLISGVSGGSRWKVRRFDCATGAQVAEASLQASATGELHVRVAGLNPDAAFKLTREP
ncbi:MAG: DUF5060 domain-containing protein, partial [Planctomycetota bacterium]